MKAMCSCIAAVNVNRLKELFKRAIRIMRGVLPTEISIMQQPIDLVDLCRLNKIVRIYSNYIVNTNHHIILKNDCEMNST